MRQHCEEASSPEMFNCVISSGQWSDRNRGRIRGRSGEDTASDKNSHLNHQSAKGDVCSIDDKGRASDNKGCAHIYLKVIYRIG